MSSTPPFQADSLQAHASALRGLARALARDDATADDLVQETWLLAMEKRPHDGEGLGAWLQAVLRRRFTHKQRSESTRRSRERSTAANESFSPVEERKSVVSLLSSELAQLDEPYQTTLFLRYFEERSVREIAGHFDTTPGTVGSRIHRGLELLRNRLDTRSGGKRDFWLGALVPFTSSKVPGAIMSGNAKLGIAAASLCALVVFISQTNEPQPLHETLGAPNVSELALADEPRQQTELAKSELTTEHSLVTVPPVTPPDVVEEVPAKVAEVIPADWIPSEELLWPPARNVWTPERNQIKRDFELTFAFRAADIESTVEPTNGMRAEPAFDWDYFHTLNTIDTLSAAGAHVDFERKIFPKWKSQLKLFSNLAEGESFKPSLAKLALETPLAKRRLNFHYTQEGTWQISAKRTKKQDPPDLYSELVADMNLSALAPPAGIQVDGIWAVKDEAIRSLFRPAGGLRATRPEASRRALEIRDFAGLSLLDFVNPDGTLQLQCTLETADTNHVDGVLVDRRVKGHRFSAELDVSFSSSPEIVRTGEENIELPSFEQRLELSGRGHGSWDSEAQFVSALQLEGTAIIVRNVASSSGEWSEIRHHGTFKIELGNHRR